MYSTPEIIARTSAWVKTNNDYNRAIKEHPTQASHDPFADVPMMFIPITKAEMNAIDRRLEPLICELHYRECFYPVLNEAVSGKLVRYTLDHWHSPHLQLRDRKGHLHTVRYISSLKWKSPQSRHVLLTGETLTVETSMDVIAGEHCPVVIDYRGVSFWVDVQQMHDVFPGWDTRLALCEELDIAGREQLAQVLTRALPAKDIDISNVHF